MEDDSYSALFHRIREECQQHGWYGHDGWGPLDWKGYEEAGTFDRDWQGPAWYDEEGNILAMYKTYPDPQRSGFAYPPASEEQLHLTEETLGFSLPSALCALYGQVANGGFGPGFGIIGAIGGYANDVDFHCKDITDHYHYQPEWYLMNIPDFRYVDIAEFEQELASKKHIIIPFDKYPDYLLPLCYKGCGIVDYIHAPTGQLFAIEGSSDGPEMRHVASSLEEWLEKWLKESKHGPRWTWPSHA